MSTQIINPQTCLSHTWHIPDNWYGSNKRVILEKAKGVSFDSAKEAKQYKPLLVRYIKAKYETATEIKNSTVKYGKAFELTTYIHTIGPSYSCTNILITVEELEAFITQQESSEEWIEKNREKEEKRKWRQHVRERKARGIKY